MGVAKNGPSHPSSTAPETLNSTTISNPGLEVRAAEARGEDLHALEVRDLLRRGLREALRAPRGRRGRVRRPAPGHPGPLLPVSRGTRRPLSVRELGVGLSDRKVPFPVLQHG